MPHLVLEYTPGAVEFDAQGTLTALNRALLESGQFSERDIKARAVALNTWIVGLALADEAFVHVTLRLLKGRSEAVRSGLSQRLAAVVAEHIHPRAARGCQISVEVVELDPATYIRAQHGG